MTEFDREAFSEEHPRHASSSLARIEKMLNSRQDLIARYAEQYDLKTDRDNRVIGEEDLLDINPDAYDEWTLAESDMRAIRETAAAFGCRVERGDDGAWHATRTQTPSPAFGVLRAIDPKGRVVLQKAGRNALLFRGGAYQPFVVAHGYDERTGEWSHGNYLDTAEEAAGALDPASAKRTRKGMRRHRELDR